MVQLCQQWAIRVVDRRKVANCARMLDIRTEPVRDARPG